VQEIRGNSFKSFHILHFKSAHHVPLPFSVAMRILSEYKKSVVLRKPLWGGGGILYIFLLLNNPFLVIVVMLIENVKPFSSRGDCPPWQRGQTSESKTNGDRPRNQTDRFLTTTGTDLGIKQTDFRPTGIDLRIKQIDF
jgi:hypothetical protein